VDAAKPSVIIDKEDDIREAKLASSSKTQLNTLPSFGNLVVNIVEMVIGQYAALPD